MKNARQAAELAAEIDIAAQNAWKALAGYKFMMFGYWAGIWVHLNRIEGRKRPSPFAILVRVAREYLATNDDRPQPETAAPLLDREAA
jgi:hypothetical protein